MSKVRVTQVKSVIGRPKRQRDTMITLGLRKMNATAEHEATPQIMGMIAKVNHLITVEEVK